MSDVYILKKDLPDVKAGRRLVDEGLFVFEEPTTIKERQYRFNRDLICVNPEWFEKEGWDKESMGWAEVEKAKNMLFDKGYVVMPMAEFNSACHKAQGEIIELFKKNPKEALSETIVDEKISVEEKAYTKSGSDFYRLYQKIQNDIDPPKYTIRDMEECFNTARSKRNNWDRVDTFEFKSFNEYYIEYLNKK